MFNLPALQNCRDSINSDKLTQRFAHANFENNNKGILM
jgi:hypothetical protein